MEGCAWSLLLLHQHSNSTQLLGAAILQLDSTRLRVLGGSTFWDHCAGRPLSGYQDGNQCWEPGSARPGQDFNLSPYNQKTVTQALFHRTPPSFFWFLQACGCWGPEIPDPAGCAGELVCWGPIFLESIQPVNRGARPYCSRILQGCECWEAAHFGTTVLGCRCQGTRMEIGAGSLGPRDPDKIYNLSPYNQ